MCLLPHTGRKGAIKAWGLRNSQGWTGEGLLPRSITCRVFRNSSPSWLSGPSAGLGIFVSVRWSHPFQPCASLHRATQNMETWRLASFILGGRERRCEWQSCRLVASLGAISEACSPLPHPTRVCDVRWNQTDLGFSSTSSTDPLLGCGQVPQRFSTLVCSCVKHRYNKPFLPCS